MRGLGGILATCWWITICEWRIVSERWSQQDQA